MKKLTALLLALTLLFSLSACAKKSEETPVTAEPAVTEAPAPATAVPASESEEALAPVTVDAPESAANCTHPSAVYVIVKEPDCEEKGIRELQCSKCGAMLLREEMAAYGHCFACRSDESGHWNQCAVCGKKEATSPHSFSDKQRCTVCGYGCQHSYQDTVVAPSCMAQGYTLHVCKICGFEYRDSYTAPTEHRMELSESVPADCVSDGRTIYRCADCGEAHSTVIPALGHTFVDGSCSVCGEAEQESTGSGGLILPSIPYSLK